MKNPQLSEYLKSQITLAADRLSGYTKNQEGSVLVRRNVYVLLEKYLNDFQEGAPDPRILILPGLRGTGKTTLLAQLFLSLPAAGVHKLYLSVDEVTKRFDASLWEILEHYEDLLSEHLETLKQPLILFLDEIHYAKDWAAFLKSVYDRSKQVQIFCTGSAALLLREQVNADIARRAKFIDIHPVTFAEYMLLKYNRYPVKGLSEQIRNALLDNADGNRALAQLQGLQQQVKAYWLEIDSQEIRKYIKLGTFPFTIPLKNETLAYDYLGQMMNKIAYTDIPQFHPFDIGTLNKVEKVLYLISNTVGISVAQLANTMEIKINLLHDLLNSLVSAGLLLKVPPYGSAYKQIRKPSKFLFATPALRHYFLSSRDSIAVFQQYHGLLYEDLAAMYFTKILAKFGLSSLTYDVAEGGADFIVARGDRKVVIEIGAGHKGVKQVAKTMEKIDGDLGVIFHSGSLSCDEAANIVSVPWEYFMLM